MKVPNPIMIKSLVILLCIVSCVILVLISDPDIYKNEPSKFGVVTDFTNPYEAQDQISRQKATVDFNYNRFRREKRERQRTKQHLIIIALEAVITAISLLFGDKGLVLTFASITWMIGYVAENIKSFAFSAYVNEYMAMCDALEKKQRIVKSHHNNDTHGLHFENVWYGYTHNDPVIKNFTHTFEPGVHVLKGENGGGKSTMFRCLRENVWSGSVYLDGTPLENIPTEEMFQMIYWKPQSTVFTPKLDLNEVMVYKGKDPKLERALKLQEKHFSTNCSGGERMLLLLYIALVCPARVVILDESMSEMDEQNQQMVMNALSNWKSTKIIIMVVHSFKGKFPKNIKILTIKQTRNETVLV